MTQPALADLIDAPLPTLKAWEIGARTSKQGISPAILAKIRFATGAIWDPAKKHWLFDRLCLGVEGQTGERFVPFTRALFEEYCHILEHPPADQERTLVLMRAWIDQLFRRIQPDRSMHLMQRYSMFLEECCRDFKLGDPREFFEAASTAWREDLDHATEDFCKTLMKGQTGHAAALEVLKYVASELPKALPHLDIEEAKTLAKVNAELKALIEET